MTKKTALDGAVEKGRAARLGGISRSDNPYSDKRKSDGRLTWSRAFRKAWDDGWHFQDQVEHERIAQMRKTGTFIR